MSQDERLWYKDAIIYELHVRAFSDSDGDGIGDFRGLLSRLDYLQDLGVNTIWLLPFYPSPLRDDGYDIADYMGIHSTYGTLRDFKMFLREAKRQGLRVITELVLNHTSDAHPWFARSRRARPGSAERDFYVWSDTPDRYRDARIIFKDFEHSNWSWDPVAGAYYWHRFYSHQPDLNWASTRVRHAVYNVVDFWLEMGVDGLRLDAVPYLFEREGTNCENLPETHQALADLRRHIDENFPNRMLLAEANQWPEDAIAYFGKGDECQMAFHFPLMPRMFMSLRTEDRFPIIDILSQTPPIPDNCQWALFLRNHDELTLEMVTDEERDYMYRVYAQDPQARINLGIRRRLAPLLQNNRRMIEMMNVLLFSLPGTPVIYYGDEVGMGDNIYLGDRNGVRTPMQWSPGRNSGFSPANPQRLYLPVIIDPEYHAEAVNVEAQSANPHSLLWWMKRLIALRKRHLAFSRGTLEFLYPENGKILAFMRHHEDEHIMVIANLSRLAQHVELDLSSWQGAHLVELFGGTEFPEVTDRPYFFTLSPHAYYWFSLVTREAESVPSGGSRRLPALTAGRTWEDIFTKTSKQALEEALPGYLRSQRWFGGKARRIRAVEITEAIGIGEVPENGRKRPAGFMTMLNVEYLEGDSETYVMPIAASAARRAHEQETLGQAAIAWVDSTGGRMLLYDASHDPVFCGALLDAIAKRRSIAGSGGRLLAMPTKSFRRLRGDGAEVPSTVMGAEQSNTSVNYGDRLLLKLFRRPGPGLNPDLELGRFLTDEARFPHTAQVAGALEFMAGNSEPMTLGILHGFVPNHGSGWRYMVDGLGRFVDRVIAEQLLEKEPPGGPARGLLEAADTEPPPAASELFGLQL
ncbi:MAG: maltose alpha-D-glucosyltransferase, partial [Actinomycetota bacterium]